MNENFRGVIAKSISILTLFKINAYFKDTQHFEKDEKNGFMDCFNLKDFLFHVFESFFTVSCGIYKPVSRTYV